MIEPGLHYIDRIDVFHLGTGYGKKESENPSEDLEQFAIAVLRMSVIFRCIGTIIVINAIAQLEAGETAQQVVKNLKQTSFVVIGGLMRNEAIDMSKSARVLDSSLGKIHFFKK